MTRLERMGASQVAAANPMGSPLHETRHGKTAVHLCFVASLRAKYFNFEPMDNQRNVLSSLSVAILGA